MKKAGRSIGQKFCCGLAFLCWTAAAFLTFLAFMMMDDPGMHGALQSLSVVFGFAAFLGAAMGFLMYAAGKVSSGSTKDP